MITPKNYRTAIKVLKQELVIKKNNLGQVDKRALKRVRKMIKNLKAVLVILEGRD